jgi:hypothetical protein
MENLRYYKNPMSKKITEFIIEEATGQQRLVGFVSTASFQYDEEAEKYAKTITAAPELLEALEKCASWIFNNYDGDYEKTPWRDAVNAINKATK